MFNIPAIISAAGYLGIGGILFAETGLLIGFFLPGDSLLFPAAFLASQGTLNIWILSGVAVAAAILGDSVGYWIGKKTGPVLFSREDSRFFKKRYVEITRRYFEKYGAKTVLIARFVPFVRTLTPMVAGIGSMHYRTFLVYNIIGGIAWGGGITFLGYFLGGIIPNVDSYVLPITVLIIIVSAAPPVLHVLKEKENRESIKHGMQKLLRKK